MSTTDETHDGYTDGATDAVPDGFADNVFTAGAPAVPERDFDPRDYDGANSLALVSGALPFDDRTRELVLAYLRSQRAAIVTAANRAVNLPFIGEDVERKLLDAVFGQILKGIAAIETGGPGNMPDH